MKADIYYTGCVSEQQLMDIIIDLVRTLEEINKSELNNQRPGGGYSTSATLSYNALEKTKKKLEERHKADST